MKSLFIISLPRTLSSIIYNTACSSLSLRKPLWTSDGEILNTERFVFLSSTDYNKQRYVREYHNKELFSRLTFFLNDVTNKTDFAYKDVVNPFVVTQWLLQADVQTLKIKRNVADVAYSMLARSWYYPAQAADYLGDQTDAVIEGLLRAERAIEAVPGVFIDYDRAIQSEQVVLDAFAQLYPQIRPLPFSFSDSFRRTSIEILKRRETSFYGSLEQKILAKRQELDHIFDSSGNI